MGLMPTPTLVIIAVVAGFTLNSSAINFTTAVNGASSGTEILYDCIIEQLEGLRSER